MANIAVNPFILKDVLLTIDADNYAAHVSQVEFTPSASTQTWQGLTPTATFTDVTTATWTVTLQYAQDWSNPDSLSYKLHQEEGAEWPVVFKPVSGSGPSVHATLVVTPGAIGGTVNGYAVATVSLAVKGKPELSSSIIEDNQWAVAVTGTPTGGTYALKFAGYTTAPIAYNATTTAVTAAINALSGVSGISGVTASGTATAYTLVFPRNVSMATIPALTGGTAPNVTATSV